MLNWRGNEIMDDISAAVLDAIDETTAAAAEIASETSLDLPMHEAAGYWWFDVTPRIERVYSEPAKVDGSTASGRFGTIQQRGGYGLFEERVFPFLRPAADVEFPKLADRIRDRVG